MARWLYATASSTPVLKDSSHSATYIAVVSGVMLTAMLRAVVVWAFIDQNHFGRPLLGDRRRSPWHVRSKSGFVTSLRRLARRV